MSCSRFRSAVLLHAHGQLSGLKRLLVEGHLENCDRCRANWARQVVERDSLRRALSPLPLVDPQAQHLMDSVAVRIRSERREPAPSGRILSGGRTRSRQLALAVTAAVLAVALSALAAHFEPVLRDLRAPAAPAAHKTLGASSDMGECGACHQDLPAGHPRWTSPDQVPGRSVGPMADPEGLSRKRKPSQRPAGP